MKANPYRKCPMALALSAPDPPRGVDLGLELRKVRALLSSGGNDNERHLRAAQALGIVTVLCDVLPGEDDRGEG